MNWVKAEMALCTNREGRQGALPTVLAGADVFVGFSSGGALSGEAIAGMARDAIVLALALPEPEIRPELAKRNGAAIVATGRADLPNGVNTAMVVPGVFRGLLDVAARGVNDEMKIAAAEALAGCRDLHFIVQDRKSTRLNSSHLVISYAVFCLKKKKKKKTK